MRASRRAAVTVAVLLLSSLLQPARAGPPGWASAITKAAKVATENISRLTMRVTPAQLQGTARADADKFMIDNLIEFIGMVNTVANALGGPPDLPSPSIQKAVDDLC